MKQWELSPPNKRMLKVLILCESPSLCPFSLHNTSERFHHIDAAFHLNACQSKQSGGINAMHVLIRNQPQASDETTADTTDYEH